MTRQPWEWALIGLMVWMRTATAGEALLWDFPRETTPQPASFRLTYRNSNDPGGVLQQLGVPWHPLEACASLFRDNAPPPDTFCTTLPTCLAPGVYTFWASAVTPTQTSDPSSPFSCQATADCRCLPVETPAPTTAPTALPPAGGPPVPSPVQSAQPRPLTQAPTSPTPTTPVPVQQPIFHLPPRVPA
jgi:hypothetical protein